MAWDCVHGSVQQISRGLLLSDHASVGSCIALEDVDFNFARKFLRSQGESAYTIALDALGGPSYLDRADYEIIPIGEPEVLSDSTFFVDLFEDNPKLKLQKRIASSYKPCCD